MTPVADLDGTIEQFGSLVGLILALITLFTAARDASVRTLEDAVLTKQSQRHLHAEITLALALLGATFLLVVTGVPLWVRTWAHWSWSTDHSVRWAFLIVWILLVPLMIWQFDIAARAAEKVGRSWPRRLGRRA